MYTYNLAYRHDTGEIEGFTGTAFVADNAKRNAIRKAVCKCEACRRPYHPEQIIESFDGLTPEEITQVRGDWKISARSNQV